MIMWWCGVESLISCDEKWPSIFKSKIMAECPGIKCWCRDNIYNSVWCPGVPTTALITIFRPFICPPIAVPSNLRVPSYELELSSDQNQFGFDPPVKMFLRSAIFVLATLQCCYCEIYTDNDSGQSLHDGYQNRLDIADILPSEELFHLTSDLFERVQTHLPSYSTARSLIEARTSSLVTTLANKQMNLKVIILIVSQVWRRQVGKHGAGEWEPGARQHFSCLIEHISVWYININRFVQFCSCYQAVCRLWPLAYKRIICERDTHYARGKETPNTSLMGLLSNLRGQFIGFE